jgi:hypothetical protein
MAKRNFLLGKGERLVENVAGVRGGAPKSHPYTFAEAKSRIAPMLTRMVHGIDQLPAEACPNDVAVAAVTLNPEYIAKSYFPEKLFESLGLEPVGSRPRRIHDRAVRHGTAFRLSKLAFIARQTGPRCRRGERPADH